MKVKITKKQFDDKDELYCNWYICPNCEGKYITVFFNYCPMCGVKLTFSKELQKTKDLWEKK